MALSGSQVGGFSLYGGIGHPRGDYSGKVAQVVDEGLPGGGGKRRRRYAAYAYHQFKSRYLKALEDEKAPALPEPIEAAEIKADVKAETHQDRETVDPILKVIEAKQTVSDLDDLMDKVRQDLKETQVEIERMQALKRPRVKKLESKKKKAQILTEKTEVISEAKSYTETFIEEQKPLFLPHEDEEQIIIMAIELLLRH